MELAAELVLWIVGAILLALTLMYLLSIVMLVGAELNDVIALAEPVLQHRMALGFAARADGLTVRGVIAELKSKIG